MTTWIPDELVDAIRGHSAIAFVGSGLSLSAGGPSWTRLLEGVVSRARNQCLDQPRLDAAKAAIANGRLISAATIVDRIPAFDIREAIRTQLYSHQWDGTLDNHARLLRLNFSIITTNYDRLFEQTLNQLGAAAPDIRSFSNSDVVQNFEQNKRFILHLHGDIHHVNDIVVAWGDYDRLVRHDVLQLLDNLLWSRTSLWLGYSHSDPDVMLTLANNRVPRARKAFQLVAKSDFELEALCHTRGITPIYVDSHQDVPGFLRQLEHRTTSSLVGGFSGTDADELHTIGRSLSDYFLKAPLERIPEHLADPRVMGENRTFWPHDLFASWSSRPTNPQSRGIAIVAPPGVGKTVLLSRFARWLLRSTESDTRGRASVQPIVVYVTPDTLSEAVTTTPVRKQIERLIGELTSNLTSAREDFLTRWTEQGAVYVLFDGLDEFGALRKGELRKLLDDLTSLATSTHVLLTCRKVFWDQQVQETQKANWTTFEIQLFSADEIIEIVGPSGLGAFAYDHQGQPKPGMRNQLLISFVVALRGTNAPAATLKSRSSVFEEWAKFVVSNGAFGAFSPEQWLALFREIALQLLQLKSNSVSPPQLEDGGTVPFDECLASGILMASSDRQGVKFYHESLYEFFVSWALRESFQIVLRPDNEPSDLARLPLAQVDLDVLQTSVYGFLHEALGERYVDELLERLSCTNLSAWPSNLVRNLVEYVGMTDSRHPDDRRVVDWLLELTRSGLSAVVRYNAARALERVHPRAPKPYFDYMSDWGNRDWSHERQTAKDAGIRPFKIRGYRIRGDKVTSRTPGQEPPMAVCESDVNDSPLQAHVSGVLGQLLVQLSQDLRNVGNGDEQRSLNWLLINYSHAWVRWYHFEHLSTLRQVRALAASNGACAEVRYNLNQWVGNPGFPFESVAKAPESRMAAQVITLEMDTRLVVPGLSVQGQWNHSQGIIRGKRHGGRLVEDHIREVLDPSGNLVEVGDDDVIVGADAMRAQLWTADRHVSNYRNDHPSARVVAWVGNGNLLSNPHFVAYDASTGNPTLFHVASEPGHFGRDGRSYACLVVRKPGFEPRINIERLRFENGPAGPDIVSSDGRIVTSEVDCVTSGQRLVEKGRSIDDEELIRMAAAGEFYDLRHLFLFGRIATGPDGWIDVGLAGFWDEQRHLKKDAVESAMRGHPLSIDVSQFSQDRVRESMSAKGYDEVTAPVDRGQYCLKESMLEVVFRRGIYPHSMIGLRKDRRVVAVAVKGLSNRVGVTIGGASKIMTLLGAEEALLIDNGGDVSMSVHDEMVVSSQHTHGQRLRSIMVFGTPLGAHLPSGDALRLVEYPERYVEAPSPG